MNKAELVEILKSQQIAVLSTLAVNNKVHGSTMFFVNDDNLNFFLLTKSNTRKFENIKTNNKVALTVIFRNEQKTIQAEGVVDEVLKGTEQFRNVLMELSEKNAKQGGISWPPPIARLSESDIIVYRLVPDWLRYSDYSNQDKEVFQQIIPSE